MAITFKVNSTTGEGTFIRVLRDGRHSGRSSTPLVSTGSTKVTTKSWAARSSKTRISSGSRRRSNRRTKDEDDDRRHLRPQVDRRRTVMRGSLVQRLQGQLEHCPRSGYQVDPATGTRRRKQQWITIRGTRRDAA